MTNHPNRGRRGPASTPTPAEIRAAREAAGFTQKQAGELIWCSARAWQDWERGERRMMPVIWWAWRERARRYCPSK